MDPLNERLTNYLAPLARMGVLDCPNPLLAAHVFMGVLNEFSLWPLLIGRERLPVASDDVVEETIGIFIGRYRRR